MSVWDHCAKSAFASLGAQAGDFARPVTFVYFLDGGRGRTRWPPHRCGTSRRCSTGEVKSTRPSILVHPSLDVLAGADHAAVGVPNADCFANSLGYSGRSPSSTPRSDFLFHG